MRQLHRRGRRRSLGPGNAFATSRAARAPLPEGLTHGLRSGVEPGLWLLQVDEAPAGAWECIATSVEELEAVGNALLQSGKAADMEMASLVREQFSRNPKP